MAARGAQRRLTGHVTLLAPAGRSDEFPSGFASFGPDDDVPKWAAEQLGDHVWADGGDAGGDDEESDVPPKGGEGSGRDSWAAYAEKLGVTVDEDDKRDDIVAKLEAAGHPVDRA